MTLEDHLIRLWAEVSELRRRQANMIRHGPVVDLDAAKQVVRVRLNPEGIDEPFKTAWVPYGQQAGDYKFHNPPTKGQNMTVLAPGGELSQAIALPFTWSTKYPSPSDKEDEHAIVFGNTRIVIKKDSLEFKVGSSIVKMTGSKVSVKSERIETVGPTFLGLDVEDEINMPKVATEDAPAKKTKAKV